MNLFEQESKYLMNTYAPLPIEITYGEGFIYLIKTIKIFRFY